MRKASLVQVLALHHPPKQLFAALLAVLLEPKAQRDQLLCTFDDSLDIDLEKALK